MKPIENGDKKIKQNWVRHHQCAGCGCWVGYVREGNEWYFDSGCDCCALSGLRKVSEEEVYDFALQTGLINEKDNRKE